ncbi:hypothetical protein DAPPUDRAFT_312683 [Daphnia pulex]|uniref:limulus clotting factor C n=1 Tax=Daphnia pulex TaxID=6669 RepID=E9FZX6_DAPPU|nr:hypothetical protein DAPPUDRAFT_312683 [Daphnia pulex]|eukprot:EFX87124.1 hypothetical protein DAPPUDRAFT_312683 [Daphnia pulex]
MAQVFHLTVIVLTEIVLLSSGSAIGRSYQTADLITITDEIKQSEKRTARMVGGEETAPNQYPFMVTNPLMKRNDGLSDEYFLYCGASLITSTQILTAAHCVNDLASDNFLVLLGMHFMNESMNDARVTKRVRGVTVHEEFDSITHYNDIAILTLESPVVFTSAISPVCLPPAGSSELYLNQMATAKGWGRTLEKGKNSDFLRHANIRIISNSLCRKSYMDDDKIADHMLCTWLSGRDACQNDSGGPLVIEANGHHQKCPWIQVGIVSFGRGCARRYPGVYTRMTSFLPWIKNHMKI